MGKQIRIYMNQADEDGFVSELTIVRHAVFSRPAPIKDGDAELTSLPLIVSKPPKNVLYFIRPRLMKEDLVIREFSEGVKVIDNVESQVVEFHRSMVVDEVCYPGRLWYEPRLRDGSSKPDEFVAWTTSLFKWIRREFMRGTNGRYLYFIGRLTQTAIDAKQITIS